MPNLGEFSKQLITDTKEVSSWKEKIRVINEDIEELTDNVPYVVVFFLPPLLLFDLQAWWTDPACPLVLESPYREPPNDHHAPYVNAAVDSAVLGWSVRSSCLTDP